MNTVNSNSVNNNKLWRYTIENENFASGCFGKCLLASDPLTHKEVVIKKIPKDVSNSVEVAKEIEAGKLLNHKSISKFREHFSNDENDFLVFDRVYGSDLFNIIDKRGFIPFPENEAKKIFKQILKAVMYSHENNIVHRDLKLENILMNPAGKITVIDFGLCDIVKKGNQSERFCGSIDYVAPEVLSRKSYDGFLADAFSLGVVLYTLLFAEFPFVAKDRLAAIKKGTPLPIPAFSDIKMKKWKVNPLSKELIIKMLRPTPENRLSLNEVRLHPWLRK